MTKQEERTKKLEKILETRFSKFCKKFLNKKLVFYYILSAFLIYGNYTYYNYELVDGQPFHRITGYECGKVETNFTELTNVKHGTRTDYYLKVQYKDRTEIVDVTPETWYDSKPGQTICFNKHESCVLLVMMVVIECLVLFVLSIIILGKIVCWIFDVKIEFW